MLVSMVTASSCNCNLQLQTTPLRTDIRTRPEKLKRQMFLKRPGCRGEELTGWYETPRKRRRCICQPLPHPVSILGNLDSTRGAA